MPSWMERIREFQAKIQDDLDMWLRLSGSPKVIDHEADRAMLHMWKWELVQVLTDKKQRSSI